MTGEGKKMEGLEILFKSNALITLKHELTIVDNRVIQLIFYNIQKNKSNIAIIEKEDLKRIIKSKHQRTDEEVKKILDNLKANDVKKVEGDRFIIEETLNRLAKNNINIEDDEMIGRFNLVSAWRYDKKKERLVIEVPKLLIEFLREYKTTGYTPINVTKYIGIGSTNAQRFYELLRRWTGNKKVIEYTVDEIKSYLQLEGKYSAFADFKKRVIESARKELRERDLLDIYDIEYIAPRGKKIVSIRFHVKDLEPRNYNFNLGRIDSDGNKPLDGQIDLDYALNNKSIVEGVNLKEKPLLAERTLKELAKKYGDTEVSIAYEILKERNDIEKIKAPKKYIIGVLDNRKREAQQPLNRANSKPSNFNNFTQREYDYVKLERQLLGWASDEEYEDD